MEKERMKWIDGAKCVGVLFVLLAHIELQIPMISQWALFFYVPVFFVLAGYTYHRRDEGFFVFLKRKAKRLLLPYFAYNLFLYLFSMGKDYLLEQHISKEAFTPLLGILYSRNSLYPPPHSGNVFFLTVSNSPTWFLTALFISLVLFEIGIRISREDEKKLLGFGVISVLIGLLLHYFCRVLLPWSLDTAFLLEGLLTVGYFLKKKKLLERWRQDKRVPFLFLILFVLSMIGNRDLNVSVGIFGNSVLFALLQTALASVILLWLCCLWGNSLPKGMILMGQSSLCIMSLHLFVFMFLRTGLQILKPGIWEGGSWVTTLGKAFVVCMTMAVLTIADIGVREWRKSHERT